MIEQFELGVRIVLEIMMCYYLGYKIGELNKTAQEIK
jgi:hypothetical protein